MGKIPETITVPESDTVFERSCADPTAANEAQTACSRKAEKLISQFSTLASSTEFGSAEMKQAAKAKADYLDYLIDVCKTCELQLDYYEQLELDRAGIAELEAFDLWQGAFARVKSELLAIGYEERLPGETPNLTTWMISTHPAVAEARGKLETIKAYASSIRSFQEMTSKISDHAQSEIDRLKRESLSALAI
jgi:hypothetical protein